MFHSKGFCKFRNTGEATQNRSPYVLVICKAAPKSMEKRKKMAIFFLLNNTSASNPKAESSDLFSDLVGRQAGKVKE